MILTFFLLIWVAVVVGNMLGYRAIDQFLASSDEGVGEVSLPTPAPRPWVHKASEFQAEIDGSNAQREEEAETIIVEPVTEPTPLLAEAKEEEAQAKEEPAPTPQPSGRTLFFGAFVQQSTVTALEEKLRAEGVAYEVQEVPVEEGTVYRITSSPYPTSEEAQRRLEELKAKGIEAYIDG